MNFEKDASGRQGTLMLNGELTIQSAGELRDSLIKSQEAVESLLLNLEGVEGAEIPCLQLLCSAHRTAVQTNKRLAFTGAIPVSFQQTVKDAGYAKGVCCTDSDGSCLWERMGGKK